MSSLSVENAITREDGHAPDQAAAPQGVVNDMEQESSEPAPVSPASVHDDDQDSVAELPPEEGEDHVDEPSPEPIQNGSLNNGTKLDTDDQSSQASGSVVALPRRLLDSPAGSMQSIPDDTPSVQGSILSSPGSSIRPSLASRPGLDSPSPSFRPFDRRFQSRLSSSSLSLNFPRPSSPYLTPHSRQVSLSSQLVLDGPDLDTPSPPWEVIRWTKLKKLNGQAFSEVGKRNFGTPTCIAVTATIVLGTSKGIILIFDYRQNLKSIIGPGTKAVECGAITSIAVSADHTTVAGGHKNGSIFTWELSRSSHPFLHIPPLDDAQLQNRTADGHVPGASVTHLGFLGMRHTALVSADERGMAFSHLATRGMGSLGRTVKTTRILGRYPNDTRPPAKIRKPSTVLAFSSLPLGNAERGTDTLGLTAMLTPYLLVIVSTTPVAETQHKAARPKEVAAHSAMSGCLAWFPAVKLKVTDPDTGSQISKVKLAYSWSNVLTVLDVDEIPSQDKDKPPSLSFKARSRWKAEEAIVGIQWLSRSVLAILTITQRLLILEDKTMRMTEGFDLLNKHIFHTDLFSNQLHNLVENLDEEDPSMHGVVADAFYMSFKAYKGKIFLLGFNDVSIGSLSNWADRLIALMEEGDYIGAISLATSYYTGEADKLTVGIPEDAELRHSMVQDKLLEIMTASLKFAFNKNRRSESENIKELAEVCFVACMHMDDTDFLFEEVFEWYEEGGAAGAFLETLSPYILDRRLTTIPPAVVKSLTTHFVAKEMESHLEEMICQLDTMTLDIDQVTTLCKKHNLYDALIYVWNRALNDYITPFIELLKLLVPIVQNGDIASSDVMEDPIYGVNALKMFPYLSYILTGRIYPTGDVMSDENSTTAKAQLYWFLFSGNTIAWPKGSSSPFLAAPSEATQPSFPYLRMILRFDAPSFLSAMNEAFEDHYLNDSPNRIINGGAQRDIPEEEVFGLTVDRRYILSVLLEVMNPDDFAPEDTIYLDMFIARNVPKFPQYLSLSGSAFHRVLTGLCNYPGIDLAEDAQLSAEYLMSVYHPPDLAALIPTFEKAGFYRVLKSIYRSDKQYAKLLQTYFEDHDERDAIFDCIADCLRPRAQVNKRQIQDIYRVIQDHALELAEQDTVQTAKTINQYAPILHSHLFQALADTPNMQYVYLRTLLEPEDKTTHVSSEPLDKYFVERYVQLMCEYEASHVADYVGMVQASDLRLEEVLPAMEESGVVDAAVILMAREGQIREAMDRLIKHLGTLEAALLGLLNAATEDADMSHTREAAANLLESLQKYTNVGIWLCQNQMKTVARRPSTKPNRKASIGAELAPDELLWLELIDTLVQISKNISSTIAEIQSTRPTVLEAENQLDPIKLIHPLRTLVQQTFSALLAATSTSVVSGSQNHTFLRILRAFLTRASISSPNLSDLRSVLSSIFSTYAYEESILSLANRLLDKDLFVNVREATGLRQRGWRPRGSTCEACGRRVWGPGASGNVFAHWQEKQEAEAAQREHRKRSDMASLRGKGIATSSINTEDARSKDVGKGKGKSNADPESDDESEDEEEEEEQIGLENGHGSNNDLGPLVVLACRHVYHQSCLEAMQEDEDRGPGRMYRCPVDG